MVYKKSKFIDKFFIDELFNRSRKYQKSEEFIKFFNFIAKFNHYSRFNTMLVYLQNESVTFFGGSNFWNKFKRYVKEDARPYVILQPFAPVMFVYDIYQTEGSETPDEFLNNGLGTKPFEVNGKILPYIFDHAIATSQSFGITISFKPINYLRAGYIKKFGGTNFEIVLKEKASKEENFAVLIHELGHLFLGHTGKTSLIYTNKEDKAKEIKIPFRNLSISVEELEAETLSFLICKKLGLETRSAEYLAGYIRSEKDLAEFSHELVIKTADKIEELFIRKLKTKETEVDDSQLKLFPKG